MRGVRHEACAAIAVFAAWMGAAQAAGPPANPRASCVATLTSCEATQLEPGFIGNEVSGWATSQPGFIGALVSELAKEHAGSVESCRTAEG